VPLVEAKYVLMVVEVYESVVALDVVNELEFGEAMDLVKGSSAVTGDSRMRARSIWVRLCAMKRTVMVQPYKLCDQAEARMENPSLQRHTVHENTSNEFQIG